MPFFPPTHQALDATSDAPGLLMIGGKLTPKLLHEAYRLGIFPWFGIDQPVMWWAPDPRMVLPVESFKFSRSLKKTIQRLLHEGRLEIRIDHDFNKIMHNCATIVRNGQTGTWIVPDMQKTYGQWHESAIATSNAQSQPHCFETWIDGHLVGGLYGVHMGRMFFGESMFSLQSNASKIAIAALVCYCRHHNIKVIDCQQQTHHLASLGAVPWSRRQFESHLLATVDLPPPSNWAYDVSMWQALFMQ